MVYGALKGRGGPLQAKGHNRKFMMATLCSKSGLQYRLDGPSLASNRYEGRSLKHKRLYPIYQDNHQYGEEEI